MKKLTLILISILCFSGLTYAEETYEISLSNEHIDIPNRQFYIDSVVDNRVNKDNIGIVQRGIFNIDYPAKLKNGFTKTLQTYLNNSLSKEAEQTPIILVINKLEISEKTAFSGEYGFADFSMEFYNGAKIVYNSVQHIESVSNVDVTRLHEENIREGLKKSLTEFNKTLLAKENTNIPKKGITVTDSLATNTASSSTNHVETITKQDEEIDNENRNITAVGYQIGGYTLIGIDYEIRTSDYFGIHFGGGLAGVTGGIKIHTSGRKNSPFFNLSYKDSGFGLLEAVGVEYGGRWVFSKKSDFGLHYQIGFAAILSIDNDFKDQLYGEEENAPSGMLSMGIGFSW